MKFKKLVSLITSAAIASSCAIGMFVFDAGAYDYGEYTVKYPCAEAKDSYAYPTLYQLYNGKLTYIDAADNVVTTNISYNPVNAIYVTNLSGDPLKTEFSKNDLNNFNIDQLELNINDGTYIYTAYMNQSAIGSGIPDNGINVALNITKNTSNADTSRDTVPSFTIESASSNHNLGSAAINYKFTFTNWDNVLYACGIPKSSTVYYSYSDSPTVYHKMTGGNDAKFTLTGNQVITFTYDPDEYYYSKTEADNMVRKAILKAIDGNATTENGTTPIPSDNAIKEYVEGADGNGGVKKQIIDLLFDTETDSNGNPVYKAKFVSENAIDEAVTKYFGDKDGSGNLTADAKQHLEDLANAIINNDSSRNIIENAIYDTFGINTSNKTVDELKAELIPTITKNILDLLSGTNTPLANYKDTINYYLSGQAKTAIDNLANELGDLSNLNIDEFRNKSVTEIIGELYKYKSQLTDATNGTWTLQDIINEIKTQSKALLTEQNADGSTTTYSITDILNKIKDASSTAYNNAFKDATNYTNSTLSSYAKQIDLNTLEARLKELSDLVTKLQNRVSALEVYTSYPYASSIYDWANSNNIDTSWFITQVTNEVAKRLSGYSTTYGYNYGYGLSAYDIAVKNGFKGTEKEWLNSLVGESAYEIAVNHGFKGSESAWLNSLKGEDGQDGRDGRDGRDAVSYNTAATERVVYVYGNQTNASSGANSDMTQAQNVSVRPANPATGAAAGIIIPAAAAASLFLAKKSKRRRGRK